eukprot:31260-Pelagococcus_subviridis.AAC.4
MNECTIYQHRVANQPKPTDRPQKHTTPYAIKGTRSRPAPRVSSYASRACSPPPRLRALASPSEFARSSSSRCQSDALCTPSSSSLLIPLKSAAFVGFTAAKASSFAASFVSSPSAAKTRSAAPRTLREDDGAKEDAFAARTGAPVIATDLRAVDAWRARGIPGAGERGRTEGGQRGEGAGRIDLMDRIWVVRRAPLPLATSPAASSLRAGDGGVARARGRARGFRRRGRRGDVVARGRARRVDDRGARRARSRATPRRRVRRAMKPNPLPSISRDARETTDLDARGRERRDSHLDGARRGETHRGHGHGERHLEPGVREVCVRAAPGQ